MAGTRLLCCSRFSLGAARRNADHRVIVYQCSEDEQFGDALWFQDTSIPYRAILDLRISGGSGMFVKSCHGINGALF